MISDLHLGAQHGRRPAAPPRAARAADGRASRGVDRLVILGDGARAAPRAAPRRARPSPARSSRSSGEALGPTASWSCTAGNHDHGARGGVDRRPAHDRAVRVLGLEQRIEPREAGRSPRALAERARRRRGVEVAYPGVWLRDDVYAIHGHYLDLHATVPTFERLAAGAMARWVGRCPSAAPRPTTTRRCSRRCTRGCTRSPSAPSDALAAPGRARRPRAWVALGGRGRRPAAAARAALRRRLPRRRSRRSTRSASARSSADLTGAGAAARQLRGMGEVLAPPRRRRAPHVDLRPHAPLRPVAGRRRSPSGRRAPAAGSTTPASWVYEPHFLARRPTGRPTGRGRAVVVEDDGPPRLSGCWATGATRSCHPRREARRVARHAVADLELEHALGVVRVLDEREAARAGRPRRAAVDAHLAVAVEHAPTRRPPRTGRSRRPAGRRSARGSSAPGVVLGAQRRERLALDAEQLLDLALGLRVGALAVVAASSAPSRVPQVARRPALVAVEVPQLELARRSRPGTRSPSRSTARADGVLVARRARSRRSGCRSRAARRSA